MEPTSELLENVIFDHVPVDETSLRQLIRDQTRKFVTTVFPDDSIQTVSKADFRVLNHLNYQLKHPGDEQDGFTEAIRNECRALILPGRSDEVASDIADFFVEHCDLQFLETCADFIDDPEGDVEDYAWTFKRLSEFAEVIVSTRKSSRAALLASDSSDDSGVAEWKHGDSVTGATIEMDSSSSLAAAPAIKSHSHAQEDDKATVTSAVVNSFQHTQEIGQNWQAPKSRIEAAWKDCALETLLDDVCNGTETLNGLVAAYRNHHLQPGPTITAAYKVRPRRTEVS